MPLKGPSKVTNSIFKTSVFVWGWEGFRSFVLKIIIQCRWRMPSYVWVPKIEINILLDRGLAAERVGGWVLVEKY